MRTCQRASRAEGGAIEGGTGEDGWSVDEGHIGSRVRINGRMKMIAVAATLKAMEVICAAGCNYRSGRLC